MTRSPALMSSACATAQAVSNSEIARRARPIVFMLIASFSIDRAENGPAFFHDDLPPPSASAFGTPACRGAEHRLECHLHVTIGTSFQHTLLFPCPAQTMLTSPSLDR